MSSKSLHSSRPDRRARGAREVAFALQSLCMLRNAARRAFAVKLRAGQAAAARRIASHVRFLGKLIDALHAEARASARMRAG
jgi:hypothetical protein